MLRLWRCRGARGRAPSRGSPAPARRAAGLPHRPLAPHAYTRRADRADNTLPFPLQSAAARTADEIDRERVEPPCAWPGARVVVNVARIDRRHRLDENPPAPPRRFALEGSAATAAPADAAGSSPSSSTDRARRRSLAVDEGEGAQRRDRLVETLAPELRRQRLAELLARLGKQEQRDRLGREQRRIRSAARRRDAAWRPRRWRGRTSSRPSGRRDSRADASLLGVEQPHRRRLEPARVFGEGDAEPLAIGRRLLVGERQAPERLR